MRGGIHRRLKGRRQRFMIAPGGGGAAASLPLSDLVIEASDGGDFIGPDSVVSGFGENEVPAGSYNGTDYVQVALSRQNLQVESRDYDDDDWNKNNVDVTASQTDPAGDSTADKLTPTTDDDHHAVQDAVSVDGSSYYVFSLFMKNNGYKYPEIIPGAGKFVGSPLAIWDVDAGVVDTETDCIAKISAEIATGWYRGSLATLSDTSGNATNSQPKILDNSKTLVFPGDGTSGIYAWQAQCDEGFTYPGPIIHTEADPVTRAADVVYWEQVDIPTALASGKYQIKIIPWWDHDSDTENHVILNMSDDSFILWWDGTNKKFVIDDGNGNNITTAAITLTRDNEITLSWDPVAGTLTVAGADSGNGEHSGDALDGIVVAAKLYLGSTESAATQFEGSLSGLTPWS